jgi:hypothetical protein
MTQSANYIGASEPAPSETAGHNSESTPQTVESTEISYVFEAAPKKPANRSVALLLVAALAGGGWFFWHWHTGPQSASAATVAAADAATANRTIGQFLNGGSTNLKSMEAILHNTEKVVQQFNNYPSVRQVPLSGLQTNPFRQSLKNDDSDSREKLDEQREAVEKAYQSLQLQSIMHADKNSSCLVNNTLYREGQQVNGFSIEKINADSISLKQGDWRFELKMQK